MRIKRFILVMGVFGFFISCGKETLKPSELIRWVNNEENGLVKKQNFEHFEFEVKYKPTDFIIAMENRSDEIQESKYLQLKSEVEGMQYIDMKIKTVGENLDALTGAIQDQDEYYERLDYFVTYAQFDISLVQGKDTLLPQLYHFERTYGLTPYNTILLGFEDTKSNDDRTLIVNDRVLGIGKIKFVFEESKIDATPILKRI